MKETLEQRYNLVDRFEHNIETYRSGSCNQTQLRIKLIDLLLDALSCHGENDEGKQP
jgi:hypothetical protein